MRRLQFVVVAAGRSLSRLQKRFGLAEGLEFLEYDATKPFASEMPFSVIIHAASNAAPAIYMKNPCDTLTVNITGVRDLLECARQNQGCRVLYVSSGEVNGVRLHADSVNEDDYGRVDPLDLRMVYSEAKRAAESLCAAYVAQYGVRVVIARPCHVYGPTALASDPRVAADFAYKASRGENIEERGHTAQNALPLPRLCDGLVDHLGTRRVRQGLQHRKPRVHANGSRTCPDAGRSRWRVRFV